MQYHSNIIRLAFVGIFLLASSTMMAQGKKLPAAIAPYFSPVSTPQGAPDEDGFIRIWMLLEPIHVPIKSNTVFTDSYLRDKFVSIYSPLPMEAMPKEGASVRVGKEKLRWHSLESNLFNVKLFRFATAYGKHPYGVLFWQATVIDSPETVENVRLAVGSNGASMWWLNGEKAVMLSGDRRMVRDDVLSKRLTLRKGRNILVGAVLNGPGMSDFCIRLLNEQGNPITNITITTR